MSHKITVRNKSGTEGELTKGSNTEVLLDGKPLRGARFIKFEVDSRKLAKVIVELYAEVEIEANIDELKTIKTKDTEHRTSEGKSLVVHTVSNSHPTEIVKK